MQTIAQLQQDIKNITMKINKEFPELSKYVHPMPTTVTTTDHEAANVQNLEEYRNSLTKILEKHSKTNTDIKENNSKIEKVNTFSGYPLYPPSEDIYNHGTKEMEIETNGFPLSTNEEMGSMNEKEFDEDMSGDDLDIPGSELDDQQERVGSEDEENNYYSLGGDNHTDLEEDNG